MSLVILFWEEVGKFRSPRVVLRERVRSPKFESRRGKLLRDGCACAARVKLGMRNVRRVHLTDIWSWYRVELRVGDHLGRSEELVSRCVECDLAEPESLASLGGSAPGVVDGILSAPHKHPLSPEWIHAITILLGHPLTSKVGQNIQKWIIYQTNLNYIKFAFKWDPIQFEDKKHLPKYEETNGSISYLKSNTVKQLVILKIYMILLICQDRPADQNYHPTHFIKGEQLFKLTAIYLKTALLNEMFENPRSKTTLRALMTRSCPLHLLHLFKKGIKSDDPLQNVDKPHLSACISTITNLDVTCTLDTSCDQLLHLDPPSHSSDPQNISSVENVEIEFIDESEEPWKLMSSMNTMTMNCSYYKERLMHQMAISTIRTLIPVKIKMTSSFMPPTLARPLHCPNSWHNTTMKT